MTTSPPFNCGSGLDKPTIVVLVRKPGRSPAGYFFGQKLHECCCSVAIVDRVDSEDTWPIQNIINDGAGQQMNRAALLEPNGSYLMLSYGQPPDIISLIHSPARLHVAANDPPRYK